ncbi:MAG: hypothetical protein ACMZ64_05485 [Oleiphilus sp.]
MGVMFCVGAYARALVDDPEEAESIEIQLASINSVLRERGIEEHNEPIKLKQLDNRALYGSIRYSALFSLRECYIDYSSENESVLASGLASHLVCHSDHNGFYLPIRFARVIADENRIPGNWLGSSYELMNELVLVAPALDIPLEDGILTDELLDELNYDRKHTDELVAWLELFEAARLSIENNSAIIFR